MKRNNYLCLLNSFMVLLLVLALSCGNQESKTIKIGVIGPLTGEGATYGDAMKRGIDLAVEQANLHGGVNGKPFQAVYQDDKLNARDAINGLNYLIEVEKVNAIVGSAGSSVSLAITPVADKKKVLLISPISTADALKVADDFFFRVIPPNTNQARTIAQYIKNNLGLNKAAVYYENIDYGKNMLAEFTKYFAELGGDVVIADSYESGQKDFKNALKKIQNQSVKAIFIPGTYNENALILRQAKEIGLKASFVGGDGAYSPDLIKLAGESAEGFHLTMLGLDSTLTFFTAFKEAYFKKYAVEPDIYSAFSYDAANLIINAYLQGNSTGETIRKAISEMKYEGATGTISFDKYGDVDKPYNIFVVKDAKFMLEKI